MGRGARTTLGGLAVAALAALVVLVLPQPAFAQDAPSASVSDTTLVPGELVTVSARGLKPGSSAWIDYLNEVHLTDVTVGADGAFTVQVTIPTTSKDGPKQIVVTGLAANGRYAYLSTPVTMHGPGAVAHLSTTALRPGQRVQVSGTRFLPGTAVRIVLFPGTQDLGSASPGSDGSFATTVTVPKVVLNGTNVIVVAGPNVSGGYSYLTLQAKVTGGVGTAPPITGSGQDLLDGAGTTSTSSSTSSSLLATAPPTSAPSGSDELTAHTTSHKLAAALVLVLGLMVVFGVLALSWLNSREGWAVAPGTPAPSRAPPRASPASVTPLADPRPRQDSNLRPCH